MVNPKFPFIRNMVSFQKWMILKSSLEDMEFYKDRNFDLKGIFYVKGHYRVYHTPLLRNNPRREKGKVSRKGK